MLDPPTRSKKIHAKTVRLKVQVIFKKSIIPGNNLPGATISIFFLFLLDNSKGIKYNAFRAPQIINVQFLLS